tara:strand:+ start:355 stop:1425 length:1071 start_codon:yes stop_codon:yes gene_type:complete
MTENYTYTLHEKIDDDLINTWNLFEKKNESMIFQSANWVKYWNDTYSSSHDYIQPVIIFIYYKSSLVMILPLCIKKMNFNIKSLTWLGYPYNDICFPLIKDNFKFDEINFKHVYKEIINSLKSKLDIIILNNQLLEYGVNKNPFLIFFKSFNSNINYQITNEDFEEYKKEVGLKDNSGVFKKIKMLKKLGEIKFVFSEKKDIRKVSNFIFNNKILQYDKKRKNHIFKDRFNKVFIQNLDQLDNAIYSHLTLNNEIIAAHVGYIYKDTFYHIMPTHNIKFKKCSPGSIILYNMIKSSFKLNLKKFDFTIGSEQYKNRWSDKKNLLYTYVKPLKIKGYVYLLYSIIKINWIKYFKKID